MHRDFDAARRERDRLRAPVTFTLGGETFTLLPRIPLGATFDLIDAPDPPERGDDSDTARLALVASVRALVEFIDMCLIDADRPRFKALLARRDDPIDEWSIVDVGAWIAEQYANRPTVPSSGSSGGRRPDGPPSSATGSAAPAVTSPR